MKKVHMTLQGKGGVGKSLISSILAQYLLFKGETDLLCVDTDPINATFSGYKALDVRKLHVIDANEEINPRMFDTLFEWIEKSQGNVIVDNGASTFQPFGRYLVDSDIPAVLEQIGYQLVVHIAITGGQAFKDTADGFEALVTQFSEKTTFIVWLNPYWGAVKNEDGVDFEDTPVFMEHKDRVSAIIEMPTLKHQTAGQDFRELLSRKETFEDALNSSNLSLIPRQRLTVIRNQFFESLDVIKGLLI